ncbi:MAG: undecaprenyl/decaprenyl-phosphate alpha-N-acetylglucosaminyl 1-phosphate transferase [Bacteroides sp.]|nr:undecaprenyl/decaprenyl-phosphate alpha-N-acetylglucosaminyl 1-phosphate transferase [Bacteroides sp.]
MNSWIINCMAVFLLCIFCAGIVIPQILLIAFRKQLMDVPDERKIHRSLVPRLGGIAFKPVIFFSLVFILGINLALGHPSIMIEPLADARAILFGFCAVMVLYLVGIADDLVGVRYRAKFVIQILCAIMVVTGGIWINNLNGVLWLNELPQWVGFPLTVLVVVFITNAINLIDGIDGLASGLCGIAFLFYGIIFFILGHYFYAMISFATLGVLVPFFYYNVFGNAERQQKIFMGDTGSLTIGMILSFISIKLVMCVPEDAPFSPNTMVLAFAPMLVPGFDVVRVYLHRIRTGHNPFLPDKNHIHHKLLALGMHQRIAMVSIISFSLLLILANVVLSVYLNVNLILLLDALVWTIGNIWISRKIKNRISMQSLDRVPGQDKTLSPAATAVSLTNQESETGETNYAALDSKKMTDYVRSRGGECSVQDIIEKSGADRFRVYPMICRLSLAGKLKVTKTDSWGSPLFVALT